MTVEADRAYSLECLGKLATSNRTINCEAMENEFLLDSLDFSQREQFFVHLSEIGFSQNECFVRRRNVRAYLLAPVQYASQIYADTTSSMESRSVSTT